MVFVMLKGLFKRIPYFEALRAFLEQWGIWQILLYALSVTGALIMSAWVKMTEAVPIWAVVLIGLLTLAILLAIMNFGYGFYLKRRQAKQLDRIVHIDRDALADELEDMSKKIAALVGEFRGPMQVAWCEDAGDPQAMRRSYADVEGKLIEKYSYRHGADVWRLIRRASKVIPLDRGSIWRVEHGVRGENDLISMYMLLATLSDDVRAPKAPIPMIDRAMQAGAAYSSQSSLPK